MNGVHQRQSLLLCCNMVVSFIRRRQQRTCAHFRVCFGCWCLFVFRDSVHFHGWQKRLHRMRWPRLCGSIGNGKLFILFVIHFVSFVHSTYQMFCSNAVITELKETRRWETFIVAEGVASEFVPVQFPAVLGELQAELERLMILWIAFLAGSGAQYFGIFELPFSNCSSHSANVLSNCFIRVL